MRTLKANRNWLLALVGAILFAGAAAGLAQKVDVDLPPDVKQKATDLSTIFRTVAKEVTPGVVSIETLGKARVMEEAQFEAPFGEDSPFREFFENDPQLREFFERQREFPQPQQQQLPRQRGMGSGFVIDASGIIMTNSHVVDGAEQVKVRFPDGREFIATDVRTDPRTDVAIVRIDAPQGSLTALPLGDSSQVQVADWVLAIGTPFGLETTVTQGIISAMSRVPGINEREDYLQTDAAINPGNSGGPLVNLDGEVIGINTAISSRSGGYDGIGFAIPINMARWVADQLIEKGRVERAYLGVSIQEVSGELAKKFGTEAGQGALVSQVFADSPAGEAGIQPGDVIVSLGGEQIDGPAALQNTVERLKIGRKYDVVVLRGGERKTLGVTFREMPQDYSRRSAVLPGDSEDAPESFEELGFEVQELTPELAEKLGFEAAGGVVVTSVEPTSPAGNAGLRAGDVIEKVGTQPVSTPAEFRAALKDADLNDGILLLVRNQAGSRFLVLQ
jgi:serine protease Do